MSQFILLKDLVYNFKKFRISPYAKSSFANKTSQKIFNELIDAFDNNVTNEKEAIDALTKNNPELTIDSYKRVQTKALELYFSRTLLIDFDQKSFHRLEKEYYKCHRNMVIIKILRGMQCSRPPMWLAHKTYKKAIKFGFADISLDLCRRFIIYYGTHVGDERKYTFYLKEISKHKKDLLSEIIVEEIFSYVNLHVIKWKKINIKKQNELLEKLQKVRPDLKNIKSYRIFSYFILSKAFIFFLNNDIKGTINSCKEGINHLNKEKDTLLYKSGIVAMYSLLIKCYLHEGNYENAEREIEISLSLLQKKEKLWFLLIENKFLFHLRTKDFLQAYHLYLEVSNHSSFPSLTPYLAESWRLYRAYLQFFIKTGKIIVEKGPSGQPIRKFRMGKFLNEVPLFSKDKRRMNIAILIVQILLFLVRKEYDSMIDRMEAFSAYTYRYIKKDHQIYRSHLFIKMLMVIPQTGFHRDRSAWRARKYLEKLKATTGELSYQNSEIEVVPYEDLWDYTLALLDNRVVHY